jgi:DNA polymerase-3 subunit delta'
MGFADVIGHAGVLEILRQTCRRDRVHHAYLFAGPEGVGKELVAFQLFRRLNCLRGGDDACGSCVPCRKLEADRQAVHAAGSDDELAFTFADLMVLRPQGQGIKIDQVREVTRRVQYAPVEGRWKCILVRDAHLLMEAAANALLKTLEEPPPQTLFVLVTAAAHLLLPTILSRCQPVRFGGLTRVDVARYLVERAEVTPDLADSAAAMAEGSIGRALDLVQNPVVQRRGEWLRDMQSLMERADHDLFAASEAIASDRPQLELYLDILRGWFRDQLLLLEGAAPDALANVALLDDLRAAAALADRSTLLDRLQRIEQAERALRGNAGAQLTIDWLLLHLFRPA